MLARILTCQDTSFRVRNLFFFFFLVRCIEKAPHLTYFITGVQHWVSAGGQAFSWKICFTFWQVN